MRIARWSLVSSLVLLGVACGGSPTPPPSTAPPVATAARPAEPQPAPPPDTHAAEIAPPSAPSAMPPSVKLIEAGAAPRRALRYKFKAGTTERLEMDMKVSMAITMGDRTAPRTNLPTLRTTLRIDAKEVMPEGDLRCAFETERVELLKDATIDPAMRGALEKEMGGVVGTKGTTRISPRGVPSETEFELAPGASESLKSQVDNLRDALRQMYVPLPEEEVGKGAKWEVTSRIPMSGAMLDTKMLYSLTKLEADSAQTDIDITLSAPPRQAMVLGGLPPGATATLESFSGKGSGKAAPSFVRLVGTGSTKLAMESSFTVAMNTDKQQMKMQTDLGVALKPSKAKAPAAK